ncbi:unnamed protein product, partial [Polarella glacialis]
MSSSMAGSMPLAACGQSLLLGTLLADPGLFWPRTLLLRSGQHSKAFLVPALALLSAALAARHCRRLLAQGGRGVSSSVTGSFQLQVALALALYGPPTICLSAAVSLGFWSLEGIALWLCSLGCLEQELLLFLPISSFSWMSQDPEDNSRADELDKASTEDEEDEKVASIDTQATNSLISSAFEADFWGVGLGAAVALLSLGAYARGLHQGLPGGDGAELCTIAALYPRAIAHPPGYPLATMFGSISLQAARNLWGNDMGQVCPAVTLGMSAAWAALANGSLPGGTLRRDAFSVPMVTPTTWRYATQAEVFSLNNALAVALLLCTSSCLQEQLPMTLSRLQLGAFICGLSVTNQHILVFLCVPCVLSVLWRSPLRVTRQLPLLAMAFCLGLSPYLVPCAASRLGPLHLHSWAADISSPQGLLAHILRREYGSFKLGPEFQVEKVVYQDEDGRVVGEAVRPHSEDAGTELKEETLLEELASLVSGARQAGGQIWSVWATPGSSRRRAVAYLRSFWDSLEELGAGSQGRSFVALLAVLGLVAELWAFCKARPSSGRKPSFNPVPLLAAAGLFLQLLVFCALANLPLEDSLVHRRSVIPRFWSQPQLLVTLLAARGLAALCPQVSLPNAAGSRRTTLLRMIQFSWLAAIALGLLLASCQAVKVRLAAAAIEGSGDMIITQYYGAVLTALPNRSILLVSGDMPSMTLRYLQAAQGLRPDVAVLCWELLSPAMFSLQGQRWEQLGVRLPAPPQTRDALSFAHLNDPSRPGARPLLLLDVFPRLGPRKLAASQGRWPLGDFEIWPFGPCWEVRRPGSRKVPALEEFKAWQAKAQAFLTPLPAAADAAGAAGRSWEPGSWELALLWA